MKYRRIFVVVYDSLGIGGDDPMAKLWDDVGSNTFKNINDRYKINAPVLNSLGIFNLAYEKPGNIKGHAFRSFEKSNGKDTITGHWEMMGLTIKKPFKTFLNGFPDELIKTLEKKFDRKIIGNKASNGMEIINELGLEEINNDKVIIYTSSDSVLQICGHEKHMGLEKLYEFCKIAREVCDSRSEWNIARVIARPYIGEKPFEFTRTSNRKDLAIAPFSETVLDILNKNKLDTITVGKISDIFTNQGISESYKTVDNSDGLEKTISIMNKKNFKGLCFVNLVDFDSLFGHPRDIKGYANAIEEADVYLNKIIKSLRNDDLLIVTGDHGNDPTWKGNDHTRELIPILTFSPSMKENTIEKDRNHFGDIGATVLDNFELKPLKGTASFLNLLK